MKEIFADTSYWIALVNPRDQIRAKAISVTQRISPARVVTTEMVLVELLNSFSDAGPFRHSVGGMVEKLRADQKVTIVPQTTEQFDQALRRYKQAADKGWSLTDCASFQVMEEHGIPSALTQDQHFAQAGFEPLLR